MPPLLNLKTTSPKSSIAKRRNGKKRATALSDSSFNISVLSSSKTSTPRPGKRKKRNARKKTAEKRKLKNASAITEERVTKKAKLNFSGPSGVDDSGHRTTRSFARGGKRSNRRPLVPAGNTEVKTTDNLARLFRNDAMFLAGTQDPPNLSQDQGTKSQTESKSVIVIDDDDENNKSQGSSKTVVEEVGEDLLGLVSGSKIPDTPKTIIKKMNFNENEVGVKENVEDTIVLDDTQDREGSNSPDSVILLDEDPKNEESIQEIASRYYTNPSSIDFIPLDNQPGPSNKCRRRKSLIGKYKGSRLKPAREPYPFQPNFVPDTCFTTRPEGVFRFTGNQNPKSAVPSGPTIYSDDKVVMKGLRPIVIDGSNIAFAHGRSKKFSVKGIEMVVNYFKDRGHESVVAFLPQFRSKQHMSDSRDTLLKMEEEGTLCFTPSRSVDGKSISSYDDRMILDYATEKGGIVVSRDNYRDMFQEHPEYRTTIEKRLLMPTFVGDSVIFPQDPLGRNGPRLDEFLKF